MGLQRIFSATTIIVGLFISVDYGLCDEFRCRGYERERISDDYGLWGWQTHAVWTAVYIAGLALFAGFYTMLERFVLVNSELVRCKDVLWFDCLRKCFTGVSFSRRSGVDFEHRFTQCLPSTPLTINANRLPWKQRWHHEKVLCSPFDDVAAPVWMRVRFYSVLDRFYTGFRKGNILASVLKEI